MIGNKAPHTRMKRIEVTNMDDAHDVLNQAFKHGTHMAYDSYRFCVKIDKNNFSMIARVAAILPDAYVLVYPTGDSLKYEVSL